MAGGGSTTAAAAPRSRFCPAPRRRRARIEIIPLIDVMFFLLASFMMVSLSLQKSQTPKMDLAVASTARPDFSPDLFNIAVERNGTVSVGKTNVTLPRLDEMLAAAGRASAGTNTPIFITGDRDATHGSINRVLDRVRRAGFLRVSFTVEAPRAAAPKLASQKAAP
ncbi:MAG: biopolymer transporter ExbD [Verrucomicrobiota bacterium]